MKLFNRIVGILLAVVLVLGLLIASLTWLFSPWVSQKILGDVLSKHNLVLDEKSKVRLNLFTTELRISNAGWSIEEPFDVGNSEAFSTEVFSLDELVLDFSILPLITSKVHIEELSIVGVNAQLVQIEEVLYALGFDTSKSDGSGSSELGVANDHASSDQNFLQSEEVPEGDSSLDAFSADIKNIKIKDITVTTIQISHEDPHDSDFENRVENVFKIDSLHITNLTKIDESLQAVVNFEAELNPELELSAFADENVGQSEKAQPVKARGEVDFSLSINANLPNAESDDTGIAITDLDFRLKDIGFADVTMQTFLSEVQLESNQINISIADSISANASFDFSLDQFESMNANGEKLALISDISAPAISIEILSDAIAVDTDLVSVGELTVSDTIEKNILPLFSWQKLNVNDVTFNYSLASLDGGLLIDLIEVADIVANANKRADGEILNLVDVSAFTANSPQIDENSTKDGNEEDIKTAPADTAQNQNMQEGSDFSIQVNRFVFASPAKINVADSSITPSLSKQFVIETFELTDLDSADGDKPLKLNAFMHDGDYFKYDVQASAKIFADKLSMDMVSNIHEFSIHEVSPYVSGSLGFGIETGQLDSIIEIVVIEDALDGKVKMDLRGAKFSSGDDAQKDELDLVGQTAVPLNVALNMLKDGKGNIALTIPVSGDINDPNFGMQYFLGLVVKKAVMNQTKKHLVNTFIPYGQVLSIAYSAGSYALKVRFEDLQYAPAAIDVSNEDVEFVSQFASLMKEKEDLQVRICPISTVAELAVLDTSISIDDLTKNGGLSDEQLSKTMREKLISLAKQRASKFKKQVTSQGVESSRLLICSPEIDSSENAQPRIKFST